VNATDTRAPEISIPKVPVNEKNPYEITTSAVTPIALINKSQEELIQIFGPMCDHAFPPEGTCQNLCRILEGNTAKERIQCMMYCILVSRISTEAAVSRFKSGKDIPPTLNLRKAVALVNQLGKETPTQKRAIQLICGEIAERDKVCDRQWKKEDSWKAFPLSCAEVAGIARRDVLAKIQECILGDCHDYAVCMTDATCLLY
jgi:hypothetical protein